ncbi:MAG: hypothetical protein R2705_14720 [Ilumatobacteraceae bacterium]
MGPGEHIDVQVAGAGGVPSMGVAAVALNVTATGATEQTFATAWPAGVSMPGTSNLNIEPNTDTPNQVIVALGEDGKVSLYNDRGSVHFVVDVAGYFLAGSPMQSVTPTRLLDTRNGIGSSMKLGPDSKLTLPVTGMAGIPSTGVDSVVVNITGTRATESTYLTAWPTGSARPETSTLNLMPGVDRPNSAIVKVGDNGSIDLYNFAGDTDVIVDVFGYLPTGSSYTGIVPDRVLDTRNAIGVNPAAKVGAGQMISVDVTDATGVPATGVDSVVVTLTATNATQPSWATAWPSGQSRPLASSLNYEPGVDVANTVLVKVGADGKIELYNDRGDVDLLVDVLGYIAR